MSDPSDKKTQKPGVPEVPQIRAQKPTRPTMVSPDSARKHELPPVAPVPSEQKPARPTMVASPSAAAQRPALLTVVPERTVDDRPRPRSDRASRRGELLPGPRLPNASPFAFSQTKARAEKTVGAFDALGGIAFPTDKEREVAKIYRYVSVEAKSVFDVRGCILASRDRPSREFTAAKQKLKIPPSRSNTETQVWHMEHSYRYAREVARLGDENGHRTVATVFLNGVASVESVQPTVEVHLFQSPDIPAWRSRVVSTDDSGSGGRRASTDGGMETLTAILEPNLDRVNKLADRRWVAFAADYAGKPKSPEELSQLLFDEIYAAENALALGRRKVAEEIGPACFARLWNSALASYTNVRNPAVEEEKSVAATNPAPAD